MKKTRRAIAKKMLPELEADLARRKRRLPLEEWNAKAVCSRLTPRAVEALSLLLVRGYDHPIHFADTDPVYRQLAKLGYAEFDPTSVKTCRITDEGVLRLIDPAALLK